MTDQTRYTTVTIKGDLPTIYAVMRVLQRHMPKVRPQTRRPKKWGGNNRQYTARMGVALDTNEGDEDDLQAS